MATPRKPWPEWCGADYYLLRDLAGRVKKNCNLAYELQNKNIPQTINILSKLISDGQAIDGIARQIEMNKDDTERLPNWVNTALGIAKKSGRFISAGGKHGLEGIDKDNWKMVTTGLNTCSEHAHKIEVALMQGPPPPNEDIIKTLRMGKTTSTPVGGRWRRE